MSFWTAQPVFVNMKIVSYKTTVKWHTFRTGIFSPPQQLRSLTKSHRYLKKKKNTDNSCHRGLNHLLVRATHFILDPWDWKEQWFIERIQVSFCFCSYCNSFHASFIFQFASLHLCNSPKVALSLPAARQGEHWVCVLMHVCHIMLTT